MYRDLPEKCVEIKQGNIAAITLASLALLSYHASSSSSSNSYSVLAAATEEELDQF
jgi:hypothetical protein